MVSFGVVGILLTSAIFILQVNSLRHVVKENELFSINCPMSLGSIQILKATWRYRRSNLKNAFSFNIRNVVHLVGPYIGMGTWNVTKYLQEQCTCRGACTIIPTRDLLGDSGYAMNLEVEYYCGPCQSFMEVSLLSG